MARTPAALREHDPAASKSRSRYAAAAESAPALLEQLELAAQETLSTRSEISVARGIVGESVRMLARATAENDGVMPQAVAQLVLSQLREVNQLVATAAAVEAKRVDQQFDAAKMILLVGRLRTDICLRLKEAGFAGAVPFVRAAFGEARWTGALDQAAVEAAMAAPESFDIKFRPIERDAAGKLLEHRESFDTPEDALAAAPDLDLTTRSAKLSDARNVASDASNKGKTPLARIEDAALKSELAQANDLLDQEIAAAQDAGQPLPGVSDARLTKLDQNTRRMLEGER